MIYLTQEEVNDLPDGTHVVITWSGGNGPHRYVIERNKHGAVSAAGNPITFVGSERPLTRVTLEEIDGDS